MSGGQRCCVTHLLCDDTNHQPYTNHNTSGFNFRYIYVKSLRLLSRYVLGNVLFFCPPYSRVIANYPDFPAVDLFVEPHFGHLLPLLEPLHS